jgi:hypothetical protein
VVKSSERETRRDSAGLSGAVADEPSVQGRENPLMRRFPLLFFLPVFLILLVPAHAAPGASEKAPAAPGKKTVTAPEPKQLLSAALPEDFPPTGPPMGKDEPYTWENLPEIAALSLGDLARFDPTTVPQEIIEEEEWQNALERPFFYRIRAGREGNPLALALAGDYDSFDSEEFWFRQADILTRPGWGMVAVVRYGSIGCITDRAKHLGDGQSLKYAQAHSRWPLDSDSQNAAKAGYPPAMGEAALDFFHRKTFPAEFRAWAWESGMRGYPAAWLALGGAHADGVVPGIERDPIEAWAMLQMAMNLPPMPPGYNVKPFAARVFREDLVEPGLLTEAMMPQAEARAAALRAQYEAGRLAVLEAQRAHRAEKLPAVRAAVDAWIEGRIRQDCGEDRDMTDTVRLARGRDFTRRQWCDELNTLLKE